jgi:hypothetical protein
MDTYERYTYRPIGIRCSFSFCVLRIGDFTTYYLFNKDKPEPSPHQSNIAYTRSLPMYSVFTEPYELECQLCTRSYKDLYVKFCEYDEVARAHHIKFNNSYEQNVTTTELFKNSLSKWVDYSITNDLIVQYWERRRYPIVKQLNIKITSKAPSIAGITYPVTLQIYNPYTGVTYLMIGDSTYQELYVSFYAHEVNVPGSAELCKTINSSNWNETMAKASKHKWQALLNLLFPIESIESTIKQFNGI